MSDIVGRLRMFHESPLPDDMTHYFDAANSLMCEAATEIDRLRAIIENVALAIGHKDVPMILEH